MSNAEGDGIILDNVKINRIEEYKCLREIVSFRNKQMKELKERKKKAWGLRIIKNKKMTVQAKVMLNKFSRRNG